MIDLETVRTHCLSKKGTITEEFPFDEDTLVFKVFNKSFLFTDVRRFPLSINLKCDPEKAIELREKYDAVRPGYHMNKKYWNTVDCSGGIPDRLIIEMIDHSYDEVVKKLPRKLRATIGAE